MREYKLTVLGSGGVGKSAITSQYVQGVFLDEYDPTIEDSYRRQATVDERAYTLEILDTAGIEQFTAMRELYIRNSDGFVLVYSVTNESSFNELRALHAQIARLKDNCNVPVVLVGNKCDLTHERQVSYFDGQALAKEWGRVPFYETSAKECVHIDDVFSSLVRLTARRDSAIGSSLRNPSISGSVDSAQTRIHHAQSKPLLSMKASLTRLRERKSMRRLASVASFANLRKQYGKHDEVSDAFDSHYQTPQRPPQLKDHVTPLRASHAQPYPVSAERTALDAEPDIPHVADRKSKKHCIIM